MGILNLTASSERCLVQHNSISLERLSSFHCFIRYMLAVAHKASLVIYRLGRDDMTFKRLRRSVARTGMTTPALSTRGASSVEKECIIYWLKRLCVLYYFKSQGVQLHMTREGYWLNAQSAVILACMNGTKAHFNFVTMATINRPHLVGLASSTF